MCGIVAYLGSFDNGMDFILSGLNLLQNRGYDSAGVSCILGSTGELYTRKYASKEGRDSLQLLRTEVQDKATNLIIGHTRWATHGRKTDGNAHPHGDNKCRISLVHNGIIENYYELKTELQNAGYRFQSQTDTEVIAVLIGRFLDNGLPMETAIENTVLKIKGTWALVIIHCDYPNKLWITRNGSPLLLGMDDEYIMVASEQIAFGNHISKYISLENDDILEISRENGRISYNKDIHRYAVKHKRVTEIEYQPMEFDHWMIKEIYEQPDSILRAMNNGGRIKSNVSVKLGGLDAKREALLKINHLILLGCGTSYYAGLWSLDLFKTIGDLITVVIYDGADFQAKDIPANGITGVILLSQSGETKDLHRCIQIAKDNDLFTIGAINVVDSFIARETDCGVYLNAGREVAVASTKSFTNQCVVLAMIAVWFSQTQKTNVKKRRQIIEDLRKLPLQITYLIRDYLPTVQGILTRLGNAKSAFVLGKGNVAAVASEGSLQIKEVCYVHAEGYSTSALKHGPFALIEKNTPILLLDVDEEHRDKTQNAYQEIASREAFVVTFTDHPVPMYEENENCVVQVESNKTFGGLLANVFLQLLSYHWAIQLGNNPDFPRNLAKVVTVE
jgi:glucosamine--fructose-6-phosphate aminotransferase (isomerizing)